MDLLKQMLKEIAEDMNFVLDNLSDNLSTREDKEELNSYIRKIDFATFVLTNELFPEEVELNDITEQKIS